MRAGPGGAGKRHRRSVSVAPAPLAATCCAMPRVTRRTAIRAAPALPAALSVRRAPERGLANPAVQPASARPRRRGAGRPAALRRHHLDPAQRPAGGPCREPARAGGRALPVLRRGRRRGPAGPLRRRPLPRAHDVQGQPRTWRRARLSLAVAREGGQDNAFTSRDVTAYFQHVEASRLPLVMRMESDRFAGPLIPADTLEPERDVILEERRLRTDSNPRARFWEAFEAALWGPQHWHGRPIIGWEPEIRAIARDDLLDFYRDRYAPANAVLVVAGDAREAEVRRLADEFYAPVPARPHRGRERGGPPPTAPAEARVTRRDAAVREASFMRAAVAPSLTWGDERQAWALEVVAASARRRAGQPAAQGAGGDRPRHRRGLLLRRRGGGRRNLHPVRHAPPRRRARSAGSGAGRGRVAPPAGRARRKRSARAPSGRSPPARCSRWTASAPRRACWAARSPSACRSRRWSSGRGACAR